jgi:hypothetical protein
MIFGNGIQYEAAEETATEDSNCGAHAGTTELGLLGEFVRRVGLLP